MAAGGLNAVELHGAVPPPGWLARFDELGLPIVQLPRCDGGLWSPGENQHAALAAHAGVLAEQESRLLADAAADPRLRLVVIGMKVVPPYRPNIANHPAATFCVVV